jgi:signal transduction histidine kinase
MVRNWPIRTKLAAVLIVPLLTLVVLTVNQVRGNLSNVDASDRVRTLAGFSVQVNDLIHQTQLERFYASQYVGSTYRVGAQQAKDSRNTTDVARRNFDAGITRLPVGSNSRLRATLAEAQLQLNGLQAHRSKIDAKSLRPEQGSQPYTNAIASLLALDSQVGVGSRNPDLVREASTLVALAQVKESADQDRGYVAQMLFLRQPNQTLIGQIRSVGGAEQAWLTQFRSSGSASEQALFDRTTRRQFSNVQLLRDKALGEATSGKQVDVEPALWTAGATVKLDTLRTVERQVAGNLERKADSLATSATQRAWLGGILAALILIVSITVSLLVATPMIRELRRLRGAALEVANRRLPGVVARLQAGEQVELSEEEFPVTVQSKDEIGQVADAFNDVHHVAVRTAIEQAAMRKSIGDTFLNLARRSQALIHRQLKVIDGLERKESDPDELDELFRLDHLATRMRRHAEDLIVLSGSNPARGWRKPVTLKDVVRGSVAEVEDYTRVKVLTVAESAVAGHAVGDVIHLLAELIENATSFSPPHTPVHVYGQEVANGCVVEVEDRGLGMTDAELAQFNDRLANPPPFDLGTSERLGLFVVGRLAARHNIKVQLRHSPYGGTTAISLLPKPLMRSADTAVEDANLSGTELTMEPTTGELPAGPSARLPVDTTHDEPPAVDDLPVFPTVRSSWFVRDREAITGEHMLPEQNGTGGYYNTSPVPLNGYEPPQQPALPALPTQSAHSLDHTGDYPLQDNGYPPPAQYAPPQQPFARQDYAAAAPPAPLAPQADYSPQSEYQPAGDYPPTPARQELDYAPPQEYGTPAEYGASSELEAPTPSAPSHTTEVGLPKRTRRASLAPGLRGQGKESEQPAMMAGPRSPDEARAMMASFQSSFGRGLRDAATMTDADGGEVR